MTTIEGTLNVDQATTLDNTFTVAADQTSQLGGDVTVKRSIDTISGGALELGAVTATSINISQQNVMTTIKGTLNVDQATRLDNTLVVDGVSTFNNTTIIQPTPDQINSQKIQVVGGNGAQKYSNDGTQPAADGDNMWSIALEGEGNSAALEVWYDNKKVASFKPNV